MVQEKRKKVNYTTDDYESSMASKRIPESDPREVFLSQDTFGNLNSDDIDLRISRDERFTKRFDSENLRSEFDTINREELNSLQRDYN